MKKIKRQGKKKIDYEKEYFRLIDFVRNDEYENIIKHGVEFAKWEHCPPVVYLAIAKGYIDKDNREENKKAGIRWLNKAQKHLDEVDKFKVDILMIKALAGLNKITDAYNLAKECAAENINTPEKHLDALIHVSQCASILGYTDEAFAAAKKIIDNTADTHKRIMQYSSLLLLAQYTNMSSQEMFALHADYDKLFLRIPQYVHNFAARKNDIASSHRRIKIGYVSPDFYEHVAFKFFYGLMTQYDRENFEVCCYSRTKQQDAMTEIVKKSVDRFTDISRMTYKDAAAKIYGDGIDILVDLAGHTANTGLPIFAYKPAPVQISGIGYLATTGLKAIDYFITDEFVDPPGAHEKYFTEQLLYLPSQFGYTPQEAAAALEPGGANLRDRDCVTFGVFNQYGKITDEMLGAWLKIMNGVKNSRIIFKAKAYHDKKIIAAAQERLQKIGFDLARVVFEPSSHDYMKRYLAIDIALDTYPYTGGGTTCDALYMGVPVITLYGERRNTRFSYGILAAMGLQHLATDKLDAYIGIATALANDADLLDELHRKIRRAMLASVVGSPEKYTRAMEEQYKKIAGGSDAFYFRMMQQMNDI